MPITDPTALRDALSDGPCPVRVRAFHGTTHAFSRFDLSRACAEGWFGRVLYFTSSFEDAARNYAHPEAEDLMARVEAENDALFERLSAAPDYAGISPDSLGDLVLASVRRRLVGPVRHVHEVHLSLAAPFLSGPQRPCDPLLAVSPPRLARLCAAYRAACTDLGCTAAPDLAPHLPPRHRLTHGAFEALFRTHVCHLLIDREGRSVGESVLSATLAGYGFDSIVLFGAEQQFFGSDPGHPVAHLHVLPGHESRVTRRALHDLSGSEIDPAPRAA